MLLEVFESCPTRTKKRFAGLYRSLPTPSRRNTLPARPPRLWPRRCRQDGANEHSCAANRRLTAFTPPDNKFTLPSHRGVIVDARGQRGRSERRETGAAMQLTDETVGPPTRDPVCGRHLFAVGDGRRGTRALRRHRCASRFCFAAPPQTHSPRRSTPISRPSVQKA